MFSLSFLPRGYAKKKKYPALKTFHLVHQFTGGKASVFKYWKKINIFCFVFGHKPAQSTDVPKGVEDDEESEADLGEEEQAHTLPHTKTSHRRSLFF